MSLTDRAIEGVQVDVREQRRNSAALGNPGDRLGVDPILHHTCTQPQPQQLEHPPNRDPLSHHPQQLLLVNLAEIVPDIGLCDPHPPGDKTGTDALKPSSRLPPGTKTIRDLQKVGLKNRLQHQTRRLLNYPVANRRDTQRPHTTIRLTYRHPPHRQRTIGALTKRMLKLGQKPLNAIRLDISQRQRINASRAPVATHPPPHLPQDVTPADPVIQSVKTTIRGPLGTYP